MFSFPPVPPPASNVFSPPAGPPPSNPFSFHPPPAITSFFNTQPNPSAFANFVNNLPPLPPPRSRRYKAWELQDDLRRTLTEAQATQLMMKDNEMRICAALDLPAETKDLSIKKCAVLRIYFALMETAGKITALTRCLEDVELEKEGKGKGKGRAK
jgi:hypothetical protein